MIVKKISIDNALPVNLFPLIGILDATEAPVAKPLGYATQYLFYSGKKKSK